MFKADRDENDPRSKANFPGSYINQIPEKAYLHIIDAKRIINVTGNVENDTGPRLLASVLFDIYGNFE